MDSNADVDLPYVSTNTQICAKKNTPEEQENYITGSHSKFDKSLGIIPNYCTPDIEKTVDLHLYRNYLDRFFTLKYCIDVVEAGNDFCVLIHSNKVCALTLAPSHPLLNTDIRVKSINFQISKNVNRLENKYSGKRKRNAQQLCPTSVICNIECENDKKFTVYSLVPGKLLEINEQLANCPELIRFCYAENYSRQCYIALILPYFKQSVDNLNERFLTSDEYKKKISVRC